MFLIKFQNYPGLEATGRRHNWIWFTTMYGRQWVFNLVFVFLPITLQAAEVDYSVSLDLATYENINRIQNPTSNEFSKSITGTFNLSEIAPKYVADINAEVTATDYQKNLTQDRNIGTLFSNLLWIFSPGQFEWFTTDTYSQTKINYLLPNSPSNQINANSFSSGPNYYFRLNSVNNINVQARLEDYSYQGINIDNTRSVSTLQWLYQLNSTSTLSLNNVYTAVRFDDTTVNSNFDRNDVFLNASFVKGSNTLEVDAGLTRILYNQLSDSDLPRYRVSLQNERTRTSSIRFEFDKSLADTSSNLQSLTTNSISTTLNNASSGIYVNKTLRFTYNKTLSSGNFRFDSYKTTSDYLTQPLRDLDLKGVSINTTWNLVRGSSFSVDATYINYIFENILPEREDDNYLYRIMYNYNARRNISVNFRMELEENTSNIQIRDYEDFRIFISLVYSS